MCALKPPQKRHTFCATLNLQDNLIILIHVFCTYTCTIHYAHIMYIHVNIHVHVHVKMYNNLHVH